MDKPEKVESQISFLGYQVNKIELLTNSSFKSGEPIPIDYRFNVGVDVNVLERKFSVTLGSQVFPEAVPKNYPFSLDILMTGLFQSDSDLTFEELQNFGEVNGTAILFPFLRNIIAGVCVNANFPPIMLPVINVHNLIEQQRTQQPE